MASRKVTFELSQEQKDAIIHFINFNNWDVNVTEEQNALTGNSLVFPIWIERQNLLQAK